MSTQFSDFLAAHAARIAELCTPGLEPLATTEAGADVSQDPRQLINAVLVALTAGDVQPLVTFYRLEQPAGLGERLDRAIGDVQGLRRAATELASQQGLDVEQRLALVVAAGDELGALLRRLSVECVANLERQLTTATSTSSAQGTSLSITMHELRRPLTILNSYGQLLSTGMLGTLPETAMVAIEGITASTEMMVRMVNSLAELARLEDPDDQMSLEVIEAGEIVAAAVEQVGMEAKLRGTRIETDLKPGIVVRGDRRRLTLAITNLVGNAVKHGPPDSIVEVSVSADRGAAHFVVRDHGGGFPPEDATHLFDKYFRSVAERHRKVPGSGLGLYIVRTVAERHRGRVAARCIPGNGAEFEMIIPVHQEER
jgi:two-component system OmpR family sensor kinase